MVMLLVGVHVMHRERARIAIGDRRLQARNRRDKSAAKPTRPAMRDPLVKPASRRA
jgi:hypothetical protein